ncbi:MAG: sialidase family protein [Planctomycetaceae bacterium]|nr:sialidase family protein [Planctomycetaceae bacterium]
MNRREWLGTCSALIAGTAWSPRAFAADPALVIEDLRVISWKPPLYHGWPTLARRKNGELLLAFSGGRETHVCPFGRVELMRSQDDGKTWRWPQVLLDGPIDDRDAGIVETPRGSILVTTFTSLAYEPVLAKAEAIKPGEPGAWEPLRLREWQAVHQRLTAAQRTSELGTWMIRSTDGGVTWSARYPVPLNSPHGPIALRDGRLLYPGVELWKAARRVGVCQSSDDGVTWSGVTDLPVRKGDDSSQYHELHAVEAANGTIVCHIRNHNKPNDRETLQTESTDGGKTWSEPHTIGVWGLPSHLLRLKDGRLLMSYGHRRKPLGNQVRLSEDHGKTWSPALILTDDADSGDMGYPSTVECDDGTLVTVWYEKLKDSPLAQLRQARWRLRE